MPESAPQPFSKLHTNVVKDEMLLPFPFKSWQVSVSAPDVKASEVGDFSTLSTVIRGNDVAVWWKGVSKTLNLPKGLYFGIASSTLNKTVLPSVYYKFQKNGENTVSASLLDGKVEHDWSHDKGTFTTTLSTNLFDNLVTSGSINSRLAPSVLGGMSFTYDPIRSGLKNYAFGLKYKLTHAISYTGTGDITVTSIRSFIPGRLHGFTYLRKGRTGYDATVGLSTFSPCGAKLTSKFNVQDGLAAIGVSRIIGGSWRVNIGVHADVYKKEYKGLAVSFVYDQ